MAAMSLQKQIDITNQEISYDTSEETGECTWLFDIEADNIDE